jgi:hypothetical protein
MCFEHLTYGKNIFSLSGIFCSDRSIVVSEREAVSKFRISCALYACVACGKIFRNKQILPQVAANLLHRVKTLPQPAANLLHHVKTLPQPAANLLHHVITLPQLAANLLYHVKQTKINKLK